MMIWTTEEGHVLPLHVIGDEHLQNIWMALERKLRRVKLPGFANMKGSDRYARRMMLAIEAEQARRVRLGWRIRDTDITLGVE